MHQQTSNVERPTSNAQAKSALRVRKILSPNSDMDARLAILWGAHAPSRAGDHALAIASCWHR